MAFAKTAEELRYLASGRAHLHEARCRPERKAQPHGAGTRVGSFSWDQEKNDGTHGR